MVTFLSGGTGTPKVLAGSEAVIEPASTTVVANTGDDVEIGGALVCPDVDTLLYLGGECLDTDTWWGIADDTAHTHEELEKLAVAAGLAEGPRYLDETAQTAGRPIARWRRFSGVAEFMHIGDRDRAIHITRTGLLDEGATLTEAIAVLGEALGVPWRVLPMSDGSVATIVHTDDGPMHFQEFWVAHNGEPEIDRVEYRGAEEAEATDQVLTALTEPVVIGPSNPITSIGPLLAIDAIESALHNTPVVVVSPFIEDQVFSGPADALMQAAGYEPSTAGVADAYPFANAFVLDDADGTDLDCPVERTDTRMETAADGERVSRAVARAFDQVSTSIDSGDLR